MSIIEEAIQEIEEEKIEECGDVEVVEEAEEITETKVDAIKAIISKVKAAGEKVGSNIVDNGLENNPDIKNVTNKKLPGNIVLSFIEMTNKNVFTISINGEKSYTKEININLNDFEDIIKGIKGKKFKIEIANLEPKISYVFIITDGIMIIDDDVIEYGPVEEVCIDDGNFSLFKNGRTYKYYLGDNGVPVIKVRDNEEMFKSEGGIIPSFRVENKKPLFKIDGIKFFTADLVTLK